MQKFPRPQYIRRIPFPKRPVVRDQCVLGERPCPFVSCRYHLGIDVVNQKVKRNSDDPLDMPETCALDLADAGGMNLEEISSLLNLSRERVRQIIETALRKMRFRNNK